MAKKHQYHNWSLGKKTTYLKYSIKTVEVFIIDEWKKILIKDIEFIESYGSYCIFYLINMPNVTSSQGLSHYTGQLPENYFGKYHRGFVFNRWHVVDFSPGSVWTVKTKSGNQLPVTEKLETMMKEDFFAFRKENGNAEK